MKIASNRIAVLGVLVLAGLIGCQPDRPHEYGRQRPPVDELSGSDSGLQSKDVVDAADKVSRDLLTDHRLNSSDRPWAIVVTNMTDQTTGSVGPHNFDIFLQALKGDLARKSDGRITLITNKTEFHNVRNQELEEPHGDFAQGGPTAMNPDYALTGTALDLPNRSTDFYLLDFRVENLRTRELVFDRQYQVKVAR